MATECLRGKCNSGRVPNEPNSEAGQAWKDILEELTQAEGFQRLYWGIEVENPDVIRLNIDWDSVDAHKKFMATPGYKPFIDRIGFVLDLSAMSFYHVSLTPHPPEAALSDLSSPVTEMITAHFPADFSSSDQDAYLDGFKQLVKAIEDNATTYRGSAGGWSVEDDVPIPDSKEKGRVFTAFIGWDTVQAHMDFRETQAFKDNSHHLRGSKALKRIDVFHASCQLVTQGGGVGDDADESVQEEILNPQQGGKQSVKTRADGTTTKNDGGTTNAIKKERAGR